MKTLREYLDQYADEHKHPLTRVTHFIGIPMIVASLPLFPFAPLPAGGLFVGGWIFQFLGHWLFEKRRPSFFGDPFYLLVGPLWIAIEVAQFLGIPLPIQPSAATAAPAQPTNGAAAAHA